MSDPERTQRQQALDELLLEPISQAAFDIGIDLMHACLDDSHRMIVEGAVREALRNGDGKVMSSLEALILRAIQHGIEIEPLISKVRAERKKAAQP